MDLSNKYQNLQCLVTSPDLFSHLQDLKLDGGEEIVSFQWLGPHLLTFLKYAIEACNNKIYLQRFLKFSSLRFRDLLKLVDDSAFGCTCYGKPEQYKSFLEIIISFMPELKVFFTIQYADGYSNPIQASFIDFLFETIGELLNCQAYSSVVVSNQVIVLLEELEFPLTFLLDTIRSNEEKQSEFILKEIGDLFNEAGLFLHSFIFTTDLVTVTKMDLAISVLLERIEIVKQEIKDHCTAVTMKQNSVIGSLQVAAESPCPSEVSSSQDKSIPMVEEMVVGFKDITTQISSKLCGGPKHRQIISIVGMGGLGKTTLAKKVYNYFNVHSNVPRYFDKLSWCVVSQTPKRKKLLIDILSSVRDKTSELEDEEELAERLYKNLKGRRYLVVMDDLWDKEAWDDLKRLFPEDRNGSRILLTSRMKNLASEISQVIIEPPPLSPHESWNLLEQNVFKKEHSCPEELQEIGQEIARNCQGLPLSIIIIAGVLSNMEKKESLWQQVAKSLSSYISQKADDYIPTLKLSYMHLPNHLKPCFLYLSAFQEDEQIPVRKLLLLWIAEGFIEKKDHKSLEEEAEEYLMELINRSLVQVSKRRSDNGVKSCTLHDLVHDMCGKIAVEDEIFLLQHQFLISKHRHRLCTDRFYRLSEALSILYNSKKIRILDARYESYDSIPRMGIEMKPNLRYLESSLIVSSIGKLQNLEVFVFDGDVLPDIPAYLLNLPKLRHLHVTDGGPKRFSKNCDSSRINSLQTLSYVCIDEEEMLRCSRNLRKLKCQSEDNSCPDINFLTQLESLKFYGNRNFKGDSVVNFPLNIKKLTLAAIRLPWRKMSLIGKLPNLEILKLKWNAFVGKIWNTEDNEFQKLKFLKLEHSDLEQWNSSYDHFPVLEQLVLRACKELETIPSEFSYISTLRKIEVYSCGKNVESSAFEIREEQWDYGNKEFDITIHGL